MTFFFFLFFLLRAELAAYGSSQARGHIEDAAAGLHHSHSKARSLTHWARPGIEPFDGSYWRKMPSVTLGFHEERFVLSTVWVFYPPPLCLGRWNNFSDEYIWKEWLGMLRISLPFFTRDPAAELGPIWCQGTGVGLLPSAGSACLTLGFH